MSACILVNSLTERNCGQPRSENGVSWFTFHLDRAVVFVHNLLTMSPSPLPSPLGSVVKSNQNSVFIAAGAAVISHFHKNVLVLGRNGDHQLPSIIHCLNRVAD